MSVLPQESATYQILRNLIRHMPRCIAIVDKSRRIVACNWYGLDSFPRQLKHSDLFCHDILGLQAQQSCQPCVVDEIFASGQPAAFEKVLPWHGVVHVKASPVFDEAGQTAFVVQELHFSSFQECSEDELANTTSVLGDSNTRIEKSPRNSQERYRALVENQVELVIRWLPDTTLTYVNPAYCRFFEKTGDQLVGQKFLQQVPEIYHKYLRRQIGSVLENPQTVYSEFQSIAADGRPAWHRWSDTPILGQDGTVVEFQSVGMDITELKEAYQRLHHSELRYQHLSQHDPLTGLPNRLLLFDRLRHVIAKSRRFGRAFALLVVDLDRFKKVTDVLGHDGADRVLCQVGKRFGEVVRESDTLAKLSGDEFVIVCDEINSAEGPSVLAKILLDSMSVPFEIDGHILSLSATVGISFWQEGISSLDSLLKEADLAVQEGKRQGGNRYLFFNRQMSERTRDEVCVEGVLRQAIQNDALHLVYLPQIDLASGLTVGIEALVRLTDPEGNCILPGEFVPVAEKTGLILALGDWVLEQACRQNCLWQAAGFPPNVITVNVSPAQFGQSDFAHRVMNVLMQTGMKPCWLELEINEYAIMENVVHAIEVMEMLTRVGVRFAIDDFGKGFSCLAHLRHLPVSKLKIDRAFTRYVPDNVLDVKLVNAVVALARSLGVQTVAEGVENDRQCEFFRELQCDLAQGYLFGPPRSAEEICAYFTGRGRTIPLPV